MKKNTLILLVVFLALLLVVFVGERPFGGKKTKKAEPMFPVFDSSAVAVIEVYTESDTTRLAKSDGTWRVATAGDYPADGNAVTEILSKVRSFDRGEIASRNPEKRAIYQVDGSLIQARFLGPGEEVMAHVYVGKSGPDFSSAYVRAEGSDEVVLVRGYLRGVFDKGGRGWRNRTIYDLDAHAILRFTTTRGDTVINAGTEDKIHWNVTEPDTFEAKMNVVDNILRTFATLRADDFCPEVFLESAGLAEPWGTMEVHLEDGRDLAILIGAEDGGQRWIKRPDKDMIFKVSSYRIRNMFKTLDELRAPVEEAVEEESPDF